MALRGNLKDFSLPDVFQLVQLSGKTGVLRIVGDGAEGSIWFRDGEVFFAQSNWRRDFLGERLVTAQRITPPALTRALQIRDSEGDAGRRLGQILVDEGYITQQVLESFVQEQIQDTIFDLMRWDAGDFDFEVLPEVVHEDIGLSVSVENIVMEGSRRLEEWNRIKKKVPSADMVFKMATAPGEGTFEISLKPVEWNLLLLLDGTRSVSELAHTTHRTDFEVARVIYGLFSAGLLEVPSDEEVERLRAERARRDERRSALDPVPGPSAESPTAAGQVPGPDLVGPAVESAEAPADESPREEPEFLSAPGVAPSADDMAMFEQMMGAVLAPSSDEGAPIVPTAEPPAPRAPVEDEFETPFVPVAPTPYEESEEEGPLDPLSGVGALTTADLEGIPAPPVAETYQMPEGFVPTGDFEADLRTLGLGELPPELAQPETEPVYEAPEPPSLEFPQEPMSLSDPAVEGAPAPDAIPDESVDLDELIRSLDADGELGGVISSGTDYGAEEPAGAGVISTDAFLADFDSEMELSSGLGDELTALTGGGTGRSRPVATVSKIPEPGEGIVLHRDQMVDRSLIEKIIEGIENL
jgi:hypothetical protein